MNNVDIFVIEYKLRGQPKSFVIRPAHAPPLRLLLLQTPRRYRRGSAGG